MIKRYNKKEIDKLAEILKNDGVISVPTDTVYGLCARINSKIAHDNLVKVKNRPLEKPFPVMCANKDQIKEIAIVDEKAELLINKFMPGPITLILQKNDNLDDYITNGNKTIAIRMATSKEIELLIEKTGCPIFMSSANQSGEKTCTNLDEIEFNCKKINAMLEGNVSFNQASTIVDCTLDNFKILRQGPIKEEEILKITKNCQ